MTIKSSKLANIILMKGFSTIMLFGFILTKHDNPPMQVIEHEKVHQCQYETMAMVGGFIMLITMFVMFYFNIVTWWMLLLLTIPFLIYYLYYLIEYLILLIKYRNSDKAYRNIAFEKEAYDLQGEYRKPCPLRRQASSFSWFKYYKTK